MSIAWTTVLIIALLLPGVFALIGYSTQERVSREVLKSSAVGEVALAFVIAILIHLLLWFLLFLFGFDLAAFIRPLANYDKLPHWLVVNLVIERLAATASYILGSAVAGFFLGRWIASAVVAGYLPQIGKHKWIRSVQKAMQDGVVTAYVMTNTVENNKALMYKGVLAEVYIKLDGNLSYLTLQSCSRFFMNFDGVSPTVTEQLKLFGDAQDQRDERFWDHLFIDGNNVANVLFDQSAQIKTTEQGTAKLDEALSSLEGAQEGH
jgi:NADH:ubiquinone oxidoreductase subunit 5 (subunit L)/multisubunit Na+/H+ antiporter MnhA subunit